MDQKSPYIGKKVFLRALELTDLDSIMKHWNTYEMRIGMGRFLPDSRQNREEWIKKIDEDMKNGVSYSFAVVNKETEEFLGVGGLKRVNNVSRSAFLSIAIYNIENHGKGFGTDAVECLLKIGFNILNLHRIELHVYEFLKSGIHIYTKAGFKHIGTRRKASFISGRYVDDLIMDILEDEFREIDSN